MKTTDFEKPLFEMRDAWYWYGQEISEAHGTSATAQKRKGHETFAEMVCLVAGWYLHAAR